MTNPDGESNTELDREIRAIQLITSMAAEYKQLALLPELDEASANRMSAIMDFACVDEHLHKLIIQIDKEVAEELEE